MAKLNDQSNRSISAFIELIDKQEAFFPKYLAGEVDRFAGPKWPAIGRCPDMNEGQIENTKQLLWKLRSAVRKCSHNADRGGLSANFYGVALAAMELSYAWGAAMAKDALQPYALKGYEYEKRLEEAQIEAGLQRTKKSRQDHDRWKAEAVRIWRINPTLSKRGCAGKVIGKLKLRLSDRRVAEVISPLCPKKSSTS